jgi:beta-xylosidase
MYTQNSIHDCHVKSSIQQEEDSFHQQTRLEFKNETTKFATTAAEALYNAETWTFRKVDQKRLEGFEMRCKDTNKEDQLDRSCENWRRIT